MNDKKTDFAAEAEGAQESLVAEFWAFLKYHKKVVAHPHRGGPTPHGSVGSLRRQ